MWSLQRNLVKGNAMYTQITYQPLLNDFCEQTRHLLATELLEWEYAPAGRLIMKQQRRSLFNGSHKVYFQRQRNACLVREAVQEEDAKSFIYGAEPLDENWVHQMRPFFKKAKQMAKVARILEEFPFGEICLLSTIPSLRDLSSYVALSQKEQTGSQRRLSVLRR